MKKSTLNITLTALGAVIICICSWINIPWVIPFTLQNFAIVLLLLCLGGRIGTAATAVYILLGAVGLPVFHGFIGGIGILTGPTGGYIFGFLLMTLSYWLITKKAEQRPGVKALALIIGSVLCYFSGCIQFCIVTDSEIKQAIITTVLPFLLPDSIKLIFSLIIYKKIKSAILRIF